MELFEIVGVAVCADNADGRALAFPDVQHVIRRAAAREVRAGIDQFFRDKFGRIQNVKIEFVGEGVIKELYAQFPFRIVP